jgi:hypothetical protein
LRPAALARTKVHVGGRESLAQRRLRAPLERGELRHVEQLARGAVGPRPVERDFTAVAHDLGDQAREVRNGDVFTGADVEETVAGIVLQSAACSVMSRLRCCHCRKL